VSDFNANVFYKKVPRATALLDRCDCDPDFFSPQKISVCGLVRRKLNPSYWVAAYWYAMHLGMCGKYDEAERQAARAQELEPLLAMAIWVGGCVSFAAFPSGYQRSRWDQQRNQGAILFRVKRDIRSYNREYTGR